ncbi:MAG: hypothetical protein CVU88_00300, partial [Firmicutes bacterium HGW-Firmicutes-13]
SRLNSGVQKEKLDSIPGTVPNFLNLPPGCHFHPRCHYVMDICRKEMPPFKEVNPEHKVRCWLLNCSKTGGNQAWL